MEQEFTVSNGRKILYYIIAGVIFVFSLAIFFIPKNPGVSSAVFLIPMVLMIIPVLIIISATKRRITVSNDRVVCTNILNSREVAFADVKGYRMTKYKGTNNIILEPVSPNERKLNIGSVGDLNNSDALVSWVTENFKDLDVEDIKAEQEALSQNTALGFTEEERQASLRKIKSIALGYNILGLGCLVLLFFNEKVNVIVLMAYPFIGVLLMVVYKGYIKFFVTAKRSIYPSVAMGLVTPCLALFFKSIIVYNFLRTDALWMPAILVTGVVFFVFFFTAINRQVQPVIGQAILLLAIALFYSFGSLMLINGVFDNSEAKVYRATVLDHHISHGKSDSYYLTLSQWGPQTKQKDENVGSSFYHETNVGDTVTVSLKQGKLGMPWYWINK